MPLASLEVLKDLNSEQCKALQIFLFFTNYSKLKHNKNLWNLDSQYTDNHNKETSNMENLTNLEIKTTIAQMQYK